MKKNLMTLMFVLAFVFVATFAVSAKTPISSNNPNAKMSKETVQAKLKQMNAFVNRAKSSCRNRFDCDGAFQLLWASAMQATLACGSEGQNYNTLACQWTLWMVDLTTANFERLGCEVSGDFFVTKNTHPVPVDIDRRRSIKGKEGAK